MVSLSGPLSASLAKRFPHIRPTATRGAFGDMVPARKPVIRAPDRVLSLPPVAPAPRIKFAPTPIEVIEALERISSAAPEDMEDLPAPLPTATVKSIIAATARYYGVTFTEIKSDRRQKQYCRARHVAMYVCREMTTRSLPEIGRQFGRRDHTTVLHGVRKITELLSAGDAEIKSAVAKISAQFEPQEGF